MNAALCTAFLCVHHCQSLYTCGIYLHDLGNTWLASTSNNTVGKEENQIIRPFVDEAHRALHFHSCRLEGMFLLKCRHLQVRDTLQVCWQTLAEMSLLAIGKSENPPKQQVAIRCTIVQKPHCNPRRLLNQTYNLLAATSPSSMLPKNLMKLARKRIKSQCLLWRKCIGQCIVICLIRKECRTWCVVLVRFGILIWYADKDWQ